MNKIAGSESHQVSLKGSKECIELAKKRILEIVHDLESQVTIDCVIPQKHHRVVMGPRGSKVINAFSINLCFENIKTCARFILSSRFSK